nr:ABC transporter substrate-binding protein [Paenibacillus pasadenensis]
MTLIWSGRGLTKKPMLWKNGVAISVASLLMSGCAGAPEKPQAASGSGQTQPLSAKQSGELSDSLILAVSSEPETGFDPISGWGRYGSPLFQSTLLKRDDNLEIINDLATGYEISEDRLSWTVSLRGDARFSDGQPLTAEDVVFTFRKAADSGSAIDLTNLDEVNAEGKDKVIFRLKKPQSTFVSHLISTGIVPEHAYSADYAENPVGSGPYRLIQWDKGQQAIVEANPDYYGPKPYFQRLTFLFLEEDAAFAAAKAGQADVAYVPAAFGVQQVPGMRLEKVRSVDNRGILFPYITSGEPTSAGYPVGNEVTSDPAIRKAVNAAIDRTALVDGILYGYGSPAYSPSDGLPWWNEDTVIPDGDPKAAKSMLEQAGWSDSDGDGVMNKGKLKAEFNLLYPAGDATRQSLALAAADMVKEAGIVIRPEGKSWEEIERRMHADAVLFGWGSHDPLEMYHLFSSSFRGVDYYNAGYYSNRTVDEWMEKALDAANEEEALDYWKKAQWDGRTGMSALGDAPWAWLVNLDHLYLVNDKLNIGKQRIQPHGHGWPVTDNIEDWAWKS